MLSQHFKNAKPGLIELLRDSGSVPGEAKKDDPAKKKKKANKGVSACQDR